MSLKRHIRSITEYNVHTIKQSPLAELSGSLGDLGTLLPLMIALAVNGSIDLSTTLVFSGLTNILTGAFFGVPLPVQPMKAIASIAISARFSKQETAAAGLIMGIAVFALSATGLLRLLHRVVPVPVVKGIQVGAGLALVISAGSSMILPLEWVTPAYDNRIWSIAAFILLVIAALVPRLPYALIVTIFGFVIVAAIGTVSDSNQSTELWHPSLLMPRGPAWRTGLDAAIPQLPLTTLNSILAVTSLSATLFQTFPPAPSTTALGFSVAVSNLIGCWFGAMPICHGSGGLAGQYRFGARSGASIIFLGLLKALLGLFVGGALVPLLQRFPKALLGIMVIAAGIELAKVGQTVLRSGDLWEHADGESEDRIEFRKLRADQEQDERERWLVMLVTVAGCLAFKNDGVGFLAGLVWHWSMRIPRWIEYWLHGRGRITLHPNRREESSGGLLTPHSSNVDS